MAKFFYKDENGNNADIKRHRETEAELLKCIEESSDPIYKEAYRYLLGRLLESKAEVVNKIGKK